MGYAIDESVADHSTISRNRRLIDLETHQEIFTWVLQVLAKENLLSGKTVGVDATTLEANAAMRSIIRRDTQESYDQFLTRLAKASGIDTPTREELAKLDKKRKNKASNDDWEHPHDPDARITKMKDGRTHLAHKQEHAVDLDSGAILAVTIQEADAGDTSTCQATLEQTLANLAVVAEDEQASDRLHDDLLREVVADKGYHSNQTLCDWRQMAIRSYMSEPDRGRRNWEGKPDQQKAVYANRRRIRGNRGKRLLRQRGELIERSFAHVLETGGMRRTHLRGHRNILKRMLVHVGGFNLSLVMRKVLGRGTPRGLQGLFWRLFGPLWVLWSVLADLWDHLRELVAINHNLGPRRSVA